MPTVTSALVREQSIDIGATLSWLRTSPSDPTTWMTVVGRGTTSRGEFVRATLTPDGPGTIQITWDPSIAKSASAHTGTRQPGSDQPAAIQPHIDGLAGVAVRTFGPGGPWLNKQAPSMLGVTDTVEHNLENAAHRAVATAARNHRGLRIGASGDIYHELLPAILEQRITSGEAHRQWQRLCLELSEPAPGPFTRLLLPPEPKRLAQQPSWWFHPLGIERKRAEPLILAAKHVQKYWDWASLPPDEAAAKLRLLAGIGQWTIGTVLGPALGDPDAVAVGDYHLKNVISQALTGVARATDERMLELLEPYAGQRGRVVKMLKYDGAMAPKFGPRKRVLAMQKW